jgi:rubrerythrin
MEDTLKNLAMAFAGESQANRKYLAFANKARLEGFEQVAKLFRAAAEAETVHALAHFKELGAVRSTAENLKAAIEGETAEFRDMYPKMIKKAEAEKATGARVSFKRANQVEEVHAGLYKGALESVKAGKDLKKQDIFVCQVCGNTVGGKAPEICPICGAPKQQFKEIE